MYTQLTYQKNGVPGKGQPSTYFVRANDLMRMQISPTSFGISRWNDISGDFNQYNIFSGMQREFFKSRLCESQSNSLPFKTRQKV
jgi:hypothetical protein